MKKTILFTAFIIALVTGCVPPEFVMQPLPDDPARPVTVAAFLPLTGKNRIYAEQMKEGLTAAAGKINDLNGISGHPLELLILDTKGTEQGSKEALKYAVSRKAAAAIAGYDTSEVSMLVEHAATLRMPMVIPLATSDRHTEVSPFIYRNCFTDSQQMEVLAAYLFFWRQLSTGAVITDLGSDDEYARNIARNFSQSVQDNNCRITMNVVVPADSTLNDRQTADILATAPQFILLASRGKRAAAMFRKLRESGFHGVLCGPDSWDDQEFISALGNIDPGETAFSAFFSDENPSREFKSFAGKFRKEFFHRPGACETQSYDALIFLAIGLNNAGDLLQFDRNWRTIRNHPGAAATYTMLPQGMIDRTVYLKSIGMDRQEGQNFLYTRLTRKIQYSKIKDYRIIE